MKGRATLLGLAVLAALPLAAQQRQSFTGARGGGTWATARPSFPAHTFHGGLRQRDFRQGFGFRHGFSSGFPVFGLGFDATHFGLVHGNQFFTPVIAPFPVFPIVSQTAVVVPQMVPVPVAVPVVADPAAARPVSYTYIPDPAERLVGTPRAEERIQVVAPGLPGEPPPAPQLTLLVFKNHSIYAVTDYWLENGQLHYVTSYGGRNAVAFELIDLEMTVRLNWERRVEFALRPEPAKR